MRIVHIARQSILEAFSAEHISEAGLIYFVNQGGTYHVAELILREVVFARCRVGLLAIEPLSYSIVVSFFLLFHYQ